MRTDSDHYANTHKPKGIDFRLGTLVATATSIDLMRKNNLTRTDEPPIGPNFLKMSLPLPL